MPITVATSTLLSATRNRPGSAARCEGRYGRRAIAATRRRRPRRGCRAPDRRRSPASLRRCSASRCGSRTARAAASPGHIARSPVSTSRGRCTASRRGRSSRRGADRARIAMRRSRTASSADVPNLRDSGNRLWESSTSSRTYTAEPGAAAASLRSSPSESNANRHTPRATASRMCCLGLDRVAEQDVLGSHADRFERARARTRRRSRSRHRGRRASRAPAGRRCT